MEILLDLLNMLFIWASPMFSWSLFSSWTVQALVVVSVVRSSICGWKSACPIYSLHAHFAHKCLCLSKYVGWIHAFTVCVRQNKQFYDTYSCPYNAPYDVCFPAGQQFYCAAHVGLSVSLSPACISRWNAISPCPDCFIMTYFDYLSQGDAQQPELCCCTDKKERARGTKTWAKRLEPRDVFYCSGLEYI